MRSTWSGARVPPTFGGRTGSGSLLQGHFTCKPSPAERPRSPAAAALGGRRCSAWFGVLLLQNLQLAGLHRLDQVCQPRLDARILDRPVLVGLPKRDELAGLAAVLGGHVHAQVAAAAVGQ